MSDTLPPLVLKVVGDASGLNTTLAKVQQQVAAFGSKLGSSLAGGAAGAFKNLGESFKGLIAPVAAAATAYVSFHAAMEALNRADELGKAAASLGVTVEKLQELQIIARQTGGSSDGMNLALREMSKTLAEAADGEDKAVNAFRRLGISIKELQGLSPDEAFLKIADAMSQMDSAQQRISVSQEIFGRGSKDLAETLTVGSSGFKAITKDAREFGMVLGAEQIAALKSMNDEIEIMKVKMESLVSKAMVEFRDTIAFIAQDMQQASVFGEALSAVAFVLSKAFAIVYAVVSDILKTFILMGTSVTAALAAIGQGFIELSQFAYQGASYILRVWLQAFGTIGGAWDVVVGGMKLAFWKFVELFESQFAAIAGKVGPHLTELGDIMREWGIAGGESIANMGQSLERFAADSSAKVKEGMDTAGKQVSDGVVKIKNTFAQIADTRIEDAPQWMADARAWLVDLRENSVDTIMSTRSSIIDLGAEWLGLGGKVEEFAAKAKKALASIPTPSAEELKEYKKFLDEIQKSSKDATKNAAGAEDPMKAEQARYEAELALARKYHAMGLSDDKEYGDQSLLLAETNANNRYAIAANTFDAIQQKASNFYEQSLSEQVEKLKQMSIDETAAYEDRVKTILERDATEEERLTALDEAAARHSEAQIGIQQRMDQMKVASATTVANQMASVFGQAAALMDKNNKSQFAAWKVFATGQAVVNAMLGFTNILADKSVDLMMGGPAYRIAMASTVLGLGMAQAAKIATTPFGGGGGTSGGASGGGGATGAQNAANTREQASGGSNVNVTLYGDNFSGSQVRGLISAINEQVGNNVSLKAQVT